MKPTIAASPLHGVVPGVAGRRAFPVRGLRNADPFLMLDHIGPGQLDPQHEIAGPAHPHRGFETVSIFLEGSSEHVDSLGHSELIAAGDVQLMNAGRGILHGGVMRPDPHTGRFHEFQLWVNVPAEHKLDAPYIQRAPAAEIPQLAGGGYTLRVISGEVAGVRGPIETTAPTTILHLRAESGVSLPELVFPGDYRVYLYVVAGRFRSAAGEAGPGETLILSPREAKELGHSTSQVEVLVLAGRPIGEPVVFGGPFVMNTQAEIDEAYADFASGKFGEVAQP